MGPRDIVSRAEEPDGEANPNPSAQNTANRLNQVLRSSSWDEIRGIPNDNLTHLEQHILAVSKHIGPGPHDNLTKARFYIWRCDLKKNAVEDLKKAVWYLQDEIKTRTGDKPTEQPTAPVPASDDALLRRQLSNWLAMVMGGESLMLNDNNADHYSITVNLLDLFTIAGEGWAEVARRVFAAREAKKGATNLAREMCLECGSPASWVRMTQFAGNHPYCGHHAKQEKDFGVDDNSTAWRLLPL